MWSADGVNRDMNMSLHNRLCNNTLSDRRRSETGADTKFLKSFEKPGTRGSKMFQNQEQKVWDWKNQPTDIAAPHGSSFLLCSTFRIVSDSLNNDIEKATINIVYEYRAEI